jgi:hypothetical protein
MAFDIEQPITSAKDVKAFFNYLNVVEKCNFHPDDDFSDHIKHGTEEQAFDATKAAVLNARMAEAKQVCGDDVYEIAVDVFRQNQEKLKKEANGGTIVALPVLQFEKGGSVAKEEYKKNGGQMIDAQEFPKEIVIDGHLMRFDKGSDTHLAEFKKQKMAGAKEIYWYDPFHAYQFADGEIKIYLDSNFINKTAKDLKEAKFIVDNLAKGAGYGKEYLENTFVREERGRSYITTPVGPYTNALEYVPGKKEQAIKVLELRKEGANLTEGMKSGGTLHVKRFENGALKAYTKDELKTQYPKDLSFEAKKKLFLEGKLSKSESEYKSSLIKYVDWSETYIQKIEIDGKSFYVFMFREPSSPLTIQMWHSSSLESLENRIKSHNEISDSISFSPRFPKFQEEDEFIQAVIFNKKQMQKSDARAFLNKYGFSLNMEETTNFYKHNERNENLFDKDSFHIKEIQPGIKLVIAKLKK